MESKVSRKEFLKSVAKWSFALGVTPVAAQMLANEVLAAPKRKPRKINNGNVINDPLPAHVLIKPATNPAAISNG